MEPFEPETSDLEMTAVLQALGDPVRLEIVRVLAAQGEQACGVVPLEVGKATRSHHFKVLREAGITRTRIEGTHRFVTLRREDLEARFPGLLEAILGEASPRGLVSLRESAQRADPARQPV